MPDYRLYFFDVGPDGRHIGRSVDFECADDDDAVREAAKYADDSRPMELWRLQSFLKSWPAPER